MWSVDEIIEVLEANRHRATYGAVADVAGGIARGVMQGRRRTQRNSWVVAKESGLPTGYSAAEMHPLLRSNKYVFSEGKKLRVRLGEWA